MGGSRSRWVIGVAAFAGLAGVLACSDVVAPVNYGDPTQYVLASPASFACGSWNVARPTAAVGLFDVYLSPQADGPSSATVALVQSLRGAVVSPFHVNGLRAILPIGAVPGLHANLVRSVVDPTKLYQEVLILFAGAPDSAFVSAIGGRLLMVYGSVAVIYASVPDSVIPRLRADPRVETVEYNGIACPADTPGPIVVPVPAAADRP